MNSSGPRPDGFLYDLVPIVYRQRDIDVGEPMRAVLAVAQHVYQLLEDDIGRLYDDWFVETCEPWVLPYIGELVAVAPAFSADRPAVDLRRLVANLIGYRRAKGTSTALAQFARDVSGWAVHVAEPPRTLARTPFAGVPARGPAAADVRRLVAMDALGGPFDRSAHTVDVRAAGTGPLGGRHNLAEAAVFFWRDEPMTLVRITPALSRAPGNARDGSAWRFDPLGRDLPLIDPTVPDPSGTTERSVPARLSNKRLSDDVTAMRYEYFDVLPPAFAIEVANAAHQRSTIAPQHMSFVDLSAWAGKQPPPAGRALIDVERGRFVLPAGWSDPLVTATWGTTGQVGAGAYGPDDASDPDADVLVARNQLDAARPAYTTLDDALSSIGSGPLAVRITIADSATYAAPSSAITCGDGAWTSVRIVSVPGERPVISGNLVVKASSGARAELSGFALNGTLWLEASQGGVSDVQITVANATIVPSREPAIAFAGDFADVRLMLQQTMCGPIRLVDDGVQPEASQGVRLDASQTVIDGAGTAAIASDVVDGLMMSAHLDACTVFGDVYVAAAEVADSIVTGTLRIVGNNDSSVRTSMIAAPSSLPNSYRVRTGTPRFVSCSFARAGYARLSLDNRPEVLGGASGGGELGAFSAVATGRRLANLHAAIEEYVPYGVRTGVFDER